MIKQLRVKLPILLIMLAVVLVASPAAYGQTTVVIQVDPLEPAATGFTDPTPVAPVGGNPGTTLGQQRLNAFQFAANIWGSMLNSNTPITIRADWHGQWDHCSIRPTFNGGKDARGCTFEPAVLRMQAPDLSDSILTFAQVVRPRI